MVWGMSIQRLPEPALLPHRVPGFILDRQGIRLQDCDTEGCPSGTAGAPDGVGSTAGPDGWPACASCGEYLPLD